MIPPATTPTIRTAYIEVQSVRQWSKVGQRITQVAETAFAMIEDSAGDPETRLLLHQMLKEASELLDRHCDLSRISISVFEGRSSMEAAELETQLAERSGFGLPFVRRYLGNEIPLWSLLTRASRRTLLWGRRDA